MEISFVSVNIFDFVHTPRLLCRPATTPSLQFFPFSKKSRWKSMVRCSSRLGALTANAVSHLMSHLTRFCVPLCVPFRFCSCVEGKRDGQPKQTCCDIKLCDVSGVLCLLSEQCRRYFWINRLYFVTFLCGALMLFVLLFFFLQATRKTSFRWY